MNDQIDISSIANRLRPIFDKAKEGGASLIGDVGSDLTDKTSSSISGLIFDLFKSAGKSVWAKRRSKRAWKTFHEQYETAETAGDRERAIHKLLKDDPQYATVFRNILSKRDLVYAMREYAEHLPSIPMLGRKRTLSECYVATGLVRATGSNHGKALTSELQPADDQIKTLLARGNHLIEGNPGSGKSTLARRIVTLEANRLLSDPTLVSFNDERIPILVHADQLASSESDLPTALCSALTKELSFSITDNLNPELFSPYSANGHRKWLLVIDGVEEIPDPVRRQKFWDRLELLPEQLGESFRFIVFSRPAIIKQTKQPDTLRWQLPAMNASERKQLLKKYIDGERERNSFLELIKTIGLSELFSYPLFCAIGASLFIENKAIPGTKIELCETFIHLLLENREILRGLDR
ncbi:NACHT domain-containing NTPase, partial [Nitratireductor sp. ZSWI3]|uniref:NACHT domain-containing protein n=1 Tax=Nitratireductor sp. ZSWI3 TaxID=2966359 RepID=UPI00214FED0F